MRTQVAVIGILTALGLGLMIVPPLRAFGWVALVYPALWVSLLLLVVLHELGHALCARLLGWRVVKISLGWGRTLYSFRLAGFRFELNALLLGGVTWMAPRNGAYFRTKYFLILLAGPCVHIAQLAAVGLWLAGRRSIQEPLPGAQLLFLFLLVCGNLTVLVSCLTPFKMTVLSGGNLLRIPSDGLGLLTAPVLSDAAVQAWHMRSLLTEGNEAMDHLRSN